MKRSAAASSRMEVGRIGGEHFSEGHTLPSRHPVNQQHKKPIRNDAPLKRPRLAHVTSAAEAATEATQRAPPFA